MAYPAKLDDMDVERAIDELAAGKFLKEIAAEYGVDKTAIRQHIKDHPRYRQAIADQAEAMVEECTAEMMGCPADKLHIARARAKVQTAHEWARARDPAHWQPVQRIAGADGGPIQVQVVRFGELIEGEVGATMGATVPALVDKSQDNQ